MQERGPVLERAFELARSGQFRIPSQVRSALVVEGYAQSDIFQLEGRAAWAQLRRLCGDAVYEEPRSFE